jgi:hypothetical protein
MPSKKTRTKPKKKIEKQVAETRHAAFIAEFISNGYNATRAYLKVYPNSGYDAARSSAAALLTNPNIRERIEKEFEKKVMKKEEVLARLSDMARATHYPFIEFADDGSVYFDFSSPEAKDNLHLIKSIKTKRNRRIVGKGDDPEAWESEWVEVELHDSKDALKLIGTHENIFKPEEGEGTFTAPQVIELIKNVERKDGE